MEVGFLGKVGKLDNPIELWNELEGFEHTILFWKRKKRKAEREVGVNKVIAEVSRQKKVMRVQERLSHLFDLRY